MTGQKFHLFRRAFGLVMVGFAFAWLTAETRSLVAHDPVHPFHLMIAGVLMFVGGYLLNPPDAEAIADALAKRIPLLQSIWPGGMRKTDPPPEPNVPPPPSITGGQ